MFVLAVSESLSADYKVTSVFLRSNTAAQQSASIVAGLTNIPSERLNRLTGQAPTALANSNKQVF